MFNEVCRELASDPEAAISLEILREIWPFDLVDDSAAQSEDNRNGDANTPNVQDMAA